MGACASKPKERDDPRSGQPPKGNTGLALASGNAADPGPAATPPSTARLQAADELSAPVANPQPNPRETNAPSQAPASRLLSQASAAMAASDGGADSPRSNLPLRGWGSANLASTMDGLTTMAPMTVAELNQEMQDLAFIGQGAGGDVYRGRWHGATVAVKYIVCQNADAQEAATKEAALGRLLAHPNVVQTFSCKTAIIDEAFDDQLRNSMGFKALASGGGFDQTPDTNLDMTPGDISATPGTSQESSVPPGRSKTGGSQLPQLHEQAEFAASAATTGNLEGMDRGSGRTSSAVVDIVPAVPADRAAGKELTLDGQVVEPHTAYLVQEQNEEDRQCAEAEPFYSGEGFGNPIGQPQSLLAIQEVLLRADAKAGYQLTQIIMEHCDKGSLLQAIGRGLFLPSSKWGPRLALRALLRTAQEVAQGMWHIHQCNVIHGDLKPGNVLLKSSRADRRGFVAKVSDFGLSFISDRTTKDSKHWGTVYYMAPETFDGTLARQSDVWSFGIMLWQMVTGDKPWETLHPGQIIVGVQSGELALDWPGHTHPRLVKLGQSCLEHNRKNRPLFNYIMKELSQIENLVRLDGASGAASPRSLGRVGGPSSEPTMNLTNYNLAMANRTPPPPTTSILTVLTNNTDLPAAPAASVLRLATYSQDQAPPKVEGLSIGSLQGTRQQQQPESQLSACDRDVAALQEPVPAKRSMINLGAVSVAGSSAAGSGAAGGRAAGSPSAGSGAEGAGAAESGMVGAGNMSGSGGGGPGWITLTSTELGLTARVGRAQLGELSARLRGSQDSSGRPESGRSNSRQLNSREPSGGLRSADRSGDRSGLRSGDRSGERFVAAATAETGSDISAIRGRKTETLAQVGDASGLAAGSSGGWGGDVSTGGCSGAAPVAEGGELDSSAAILSAAGGGHSGGGDRGNGGHHQSGNGALGGAGKLLAGLIRYASTPAPLVASSSAIALPVMASGPLEPRVAWGVRGPGSDQYIGPGASSTSEQGSLNRNNTTGADGASQCGSAIPSLPGSGATVEPSCSLSLLTL